MIQTYPLCCFLEKLILFLFYSPLITSKLKNKQDPSKPFLTPDIIKSIRIKNNLHKKFSLHQKFENYRNQIIPLNRLCKEDNFKGYFETNKKD